MKHKLLMRLVIVCTILCALICAVIFVIMPYLHYKEVVSDILLPFMERRFESDFEVEKIRYSFLSDKNIAYMYDISSGKYYDVYFFDENENEENIVYRDYSETECHSTRFNNQFYLDLAGAEEAFKANQPKYDLFLELCNNEKNLMRVEWDYPEYATKSFADWNDRTYYRYYTTQKNKLSCNVRFCFDIDTYLNAESSEFADLWNGIEKRPIMAYTGKSNDGAVGFLMYVQPEGYSLHIVHLSEGNVSDVYPKMHTEKELGNGWYITTINKELIE